MTAHLDDELGVLLDFIRSARGFDFTGYKRTSLERRVRKRMEAVELDTFADYLEFLEVHPDEFAELFNTILINVTSFFRDAPAWHYLDTEVLPAMLREAGGRELRIWSAGCASGEEAYSIAMLLARHLGPEAFRERVKIYATDVDEDALSTARSGTYSVKQAQSIPVDLLETCFEPTKQAYTFRKELRRALIFGRNDLMQDAPISRIDLLLSRNVLMYFNAEAQSRVLGRFNFAVTDAGYLFLGKSEMLLTHGDMFVPVDLKCRVFRKVPRPRQRERMVFVAPDEDVSGPYGRVRDGGFDLAPVAQVVVDDEGFLAAANQQARSLFGLVANDFGRPLQDLELSYRPIELRSAITKARTERRPVPLGVAAFNGGRDDRRQLDVVVSPILSDAGAVLGVSITFDDVTQDETLRDELERSKRELEIAYEELQSTVEELETTNEELQSTNEELETTNEELQSTNEELETMNEELQSTNEELETINDELRDRSLELNQLNGLMRAILGSLTTAVVVLDGEQRVVAWNGRAEDLWGLRGEEAVGQPFFALDIGLPVDQLRTPVRQATAGEADGHPTIVEAIDRLGRTIACTITSSTLSVDGGAPGGAILIMDSRSG